MAGNEVLGIDIVARLDGLRAALKEIPTLGDEAGKGMAAGLSKQIAALNRDIKRSMGQAAKDVKTLGNDVSGASGWLSKLNAEMGQVSASSVRLAGATGRASGSMANLSRQVNDVGVQLSMGTSITNVAIMQGEQLYFAYNEAGGAATIFGTAQRALAASSTAFLATMGPLIIAVAALGAAYYSASKEAEHLDEVNRKASERATQVQERFAKIADVETEVQRKWIIATGQTTEEYADLNDQLTKIRTTFDSAIQAEIRDMNAGRGSVIAHREAIDGLTERRDKALRMARETTKAEIEAKNAHDGNAKAARDAEAAERALEAARKAAFEIEKSNFEASTAAVQTLHDLSAASQLAALGEKARARATLDAAAASQLAAIQTAQQTANMAGSGITSDQGDMAAQQARKDTLIQWAGEVGDARVKAAMEAAAADLAASKSVEQTTDALKAQDGVLSTVLSTVQSALGTVTDALGAAYQSGVDHLTTLQNYAASVDENITGRQRRELRRRVDDQRKAARDAFDIYKGAQIAAAVIGTASAFVSALDDAPYPANLVLAGLSAAAGAAQVASIASQTPAFDVGGKVQPDRVLAQVQPGEMFVSHQGVSAMGGENAINRANAGMGGGSAIVAVQMLNHNALVTRYEEQRLARNSPIAQAINRARAPGQRSI